jgi:hypothetical protein
MYAVISWSHLLAFIESHYLDEGNGMQPKPIEQPLRILFVQNRFNLSDPQIKDLIAAERESRTKRAINFMTFDGLVTPNKLSTP